MSWFSQHGFAWLRSPFRDAHVLLCCLYLSGQTPVYKFPSNDENPFSVEAINTWVDEVISGPF